MMNSLQLKMNELEAEISRNPDAKLNADGLSMQREARAGFGPLNQFIKSNAATELARAAEAARDVALWRNLGLAPPPDGWAERAKSLVSALTEVSNRQPIDRAGIAEAWRSIVADHPDLAGVDDEKSNPLPGLSDPQRKVGDRPDR